MASQRPAPGSTPMTDDEVDAYLDARSEWAMLTTIGANGDPHTVALGYFRVGPDLYLGMRDGTQKVKNAERNPRASVLVTAAKASGDVTGVLIQGDASIVRDPVERLALAREAAKQRGDPEDEWPSEASPSGVYLKLVRRRVISWQYR